MPRLLLLSKPGCHLCDEMEAVAGPVLAARGLTLSKADVRGRPEWASYLLDIPVLLTEDGREIARHRTDAEALATRLDTLRPPF